MRWLKGREERDAAWRAVAARENGSLVERKDSLKQVHFPHHNWDIVLDQYTVSTGNSSQTYTRLRSLVNARADFRFGLYRENFIVRVGKLLGLRDVTTGNPLLDRDYLVRTNDEDRIRRLVIGSHLPELLAQQPGGKLELVRFRGSWRNRPENVSELRWLSTGVLRDPRRIELLVALFRETLDRLAAIGAIDTSQVAFP